MRSWAVPATQGVMFFTGAAVGGLITSFEMGTFAASKSVATLSEEATNVVYQGFDKAGAVRYVGITERAPALRFGEHLNSVGTGKESLRYEVIPGATGPTRTDLRVLEQQLINHYGMVKNGGQLLNKINSIAPSKWSMFGVQ